jgi:hypothetical protein
LCSHRFPRFRVIQIGSKWEIPKQRGFANLETLVEALKREMDDRDEEQSVENE